MLLRAPTCDGIDRGLTVLPRFLKSIWITVPISKCGLSTISDIYCGFTGSALLRGDRTHPKQETIVSEDSGDCSLFVHSCR